MTAKSFPQNTIAFTENDVAGYSNNILKTYSEICNPHQMVANISGNFFLGNHGDKSIHELATSPPPIITSFSPSSGSVGTLVTIKGTHLRNPDLQFYWNCAS